MKESFERLDNDDQMIRSLRKEKEHTEKQMENLFTYLTGEDQYTDQLKFFGDKYRQRIEEFQNLKIENEELKKQIVDIRMSQDLRNLKVFESQDSNRISMDRGKGQSLSKMGATNESLLDTYRGRLDEIKMMKNEATQMAKKENQQYDELVAQIYKFFEKISTIHKLESQVKPGEQRDGQQDTVTVPKKLYVKLVQVYSMNMANICAKEFQSNKVKKQKEAQDKTTSLQEQQKDSIKSNYSDFIEAVKDPNYDISYFFRRLAEKFSFANEWDLYHTKNTNEAINFKGKIDKILNKDKSLFVLQVNEEKDGHKKSQSLLRQTFRNKIGQLVKELAFTKEEKDYWNKLSEDIQRDSLFNMAKLVECVSRAYNETNKELANKIETLIKSTMKNFFNLLNNLLSDRLTSTSSIFQKISKHLEQRSLEMSLGNSIQDLSREQIWESASNYTKQKLQRMLGKVGEHIIFTSSNQIYSRGIKSK